MSETTESLSGELKKSKGALIFMGIVCIILGIMAIGSPLISGLAVTIFVGSLLLVAGIIEIIHSFHASHKAITFFKGLLSLVAGGFMLKNPLAAQLSLTMILAIFFVVEGIMYCVMALQLKPQPGWGWAFFNGIVTFLLGFLIWRGWPLTGMWAIGVLVGIRILMAGWTMILLSSIPGELAKQVEALDE